MVRQIYVRPFVVLRLLYHLIDSGHEAFRDKGSAEALKRQMREAVEQEYPEPEPDVPEEHRQGLIPPSIKEVLDAAEAEAVVTARVRFVGTPFFFPHNLLAHAARCISLLLQPL